MNPPLPAFPLPRSARLAVFVSGRGSNMDALLRRFPPQHGDPARVVLVVSNVSDAPAVVRAEAAGIPVLRHDWRRGSAGRDGFEAAAQAALDAHGVDAVVLAGFLRILSPAFTRRWRGRIANVHPSLLPAHRGLHAVERALQAGDAHSGCTVHLVDAGVDTGRILAQRAVRILPGDDAGRLAARIQEQEHILLPATVAAWLRGEPPEGPLPVAAGELASANGGASDAKDVR